jgi:hypothetical protein
LIQIRIIIEVTIKLKNQPHTFLHVVRLNWLGNLGKHLEILNILAQVHLGYQVLDKYIASPYVTMITKRR